MSDKFPIASLRNLEELPNSEALKQTFELTEKFPEAAHYALDRFIDILKKKNLVRKCGEVLEKFQQFVAYVDKFAESSSRVWDGELIKRSDFLYLQDTLSDEALAQLVSQGETIHLDFAVSDEGDLIRGLSINGIVADEETLASFDDILNSALAENNMININGKIYQADSQGQVIKGNYGQLLIAEPEKVKTVINNKNGDLQKRLLRKGLQVTVANHDYPRPSATPDSSSAGPAR